MTSYVNFLNAVVVGSFFVFFISGAHGLAAVPIDLKDVIDKKAKELKEITQKIQEVHTNLSGVQGEKKTLQRELQGINSSVQKLNFGIHASQTQIQKLNLEMNALQYELADLKKKIQDKQEGIRMVLRELHGAGEESPFFLFLRTKNLSESFADMQGLFDINFSLVGAVDELKQLQGELDGTLSKTDEKKDQVQQQHEQLREKKSLVEEVKQEKDILLKETKNKESVYQRQLSTLQQKQEKIATEIDDLERQLRASFDNSLLAPRHGFFSSSVKSGVITQGYGESSFARRAYRTGFHNGIDYGVEVGTPILAAADGRVLMVSNNDRGSSRFERYQYGKYVLLTHDNNLATLYAHLSQNGVVSVGQEVKRGDVIGYSGNTGYATGPHLHFGVYWAPSVKFKAIPPAAGLVPIGVTVNPKDYL